MDWFRLKATYRTWGNSLEVKEFERVVKSYSQFLELLEREVGDDYLLNVNIDHLGVE